MEAEVDFAESSCSHPCFDWPSVSGSLAPQLASQQDKPGPSSPVDLPKNLSLLQPVCILPRPEMDSSCMEIEAAQRKLQEIEDRYANMKNTLWPLP